MSTNQGLISVEDSRKELEVSLEPFRKLAEDYSKTGAVGSAIAARIREVIAKSESDFEEFIQRAKADFVTRQ